VATDIKAEAISYTFALKAGGDCRALSFWWRHHKFR